MAELDMVMCRVALGGDIGNVVHRDQFRPVSAPEIEVLMGIHGEQNVTGLEYLKTVESDPIQEKNRLLSIYSARDVDAVFPGRNPNMNMTFYNRPSTLIFDKPEGEAESAFSDALPAEEAEDEVIKAKPSFSVKKKGK